MTTPSSDQQDFLLRARELTHRANSLGSALVIEGHGSKDFYGNHPDSLNRPVDRLSTLAYSGVVSYDPTELVAVVRSGTPIETLEETLAQEGQMLAFDPPRLKGLGGRGTVGGMVASGLSGPRRISAGACRDFVLGLTVMGSDGECMRFGGTVMKNVAGYDVSRLHVGAMGSLGLILDVSLKVLPRPAAQVTVSVPLDAQQAIERANEWMAQPLPIVATSWESGDGRIRIWFAGARAAVDSALSRFQKDPELTQVQSLDSAAGESYWNALRDQTHAFFQSAKPLWRISVPTRTPPLPLQGDTVVEWAGGQRWLRSDEPAEHIRSVAQRAGGHATLYRCRTQPHEPRAEAFSELSSGLMAVQRRIKNELDPGAVFNPGRLYRDL
ncbi:MAG: glycolate oxidase subunit GlcE [Betaproteobacteria bacterium]|nr:glycolate oxidase subunit GlcE [Betaproteobacteria bacterium]NBY14686.1 glycolate oxidase subunit GlcE [Betaproteobacteria bacterium]